MSDPAGKVHCIALSGGGANGAYEVGVLKALFNGKSPATDCTTFDPQIFLGTSIGSYNASLLASKWDEMGSAAIGDLERAWLDILAADASGRNGGYRFRGDPSYYLNPASYLPNLLNPFLQFARDSAYLSWESIQRGVNFARSDESIRERLAEMFDFSSFVSTEPWEQTIRQTIRFGAIRRTKRRLRVMATNWATGKLRIFSNHEMTDNLGPLAILASSAIPGVFPPVFVGAEPYVDGGVLMNTPLKPAIVEGADVIHVIYLDPDVAAIPLQSLQSTVATNYRLQTISWAALVNDDIEDAAMINRGLQILRNIEVGAEIGDPDLVQLAHGMSKIVPRLKKFLRYKPLTIHRYHPGEELSNGALGLLDLSRQHIKDLIDRGFADAALHNCEESGCILPEAHQTGYAMIPVAPDPVQ
jgi:predicted acylesterase/phospholipase RssA